MSHPHLAPEPPTLDKRDVVLEAFLDAVGPDLDGRLCWLEALLPHLRNIDSAFTTAKPDAWTEGVLQLHGLASRLRGAVNAATNLGLRAKE